MKSIGGYFELELCQSGEYHKNAIKLNTGRNALEYILRAKKYRKIYIPYYICDVVLEPIKKLGIEYDFYNIDELFFPIFDFSIIKKNESFLYVNYFGVCNKQSKKISEKCNNLIIDNSQSFFSKPINKVDTFYSPRKFFGVPDGAYLYTDNKLNLKLETDNSYNRFSHLVGRIENGPESHYSDFKNNDESLKGQEIKKMSNITERILQGVNYKDVIKKRNNNFNYLHKYLKKTNKLNFKKRSGTPMIYPYFTEGGLNLKKELTSKNIFIPTYWPNKDSWFKDSSFEKNLVDNLVCLPIDQRYTTKEMDYILSLIKKYN